MGHTPNVFDGVRATTASFFDIVDVTPGEELLVDDMDGKRDLSQFPALLDEAYGMGRRLGERIAREDASTRPNGR